MPATDGASTGLAISQSTPGGDGRTIVLHMQGYLDGETSPAFEQKLFAAGSASPRLIVLDLRGVIFINSMAWGAILAIQKRLTKSGGAVVIAGVKGEVASVYRLMGLDMALPSFPDVDSAIRTAPGGAAKA